MKKNKILALFLTLAMVIGIAMPTFAEEANDDPAPVQEESSAEKYVDTIYITNAEDITKLAKNCQLDTWSVGKRVVLKTDISLEQADFQQIPSFAGLFDGNGHTISGFCLTDMLTPSGLFGKLQATAIVKDLCVSGTVIPDGDGKFVGGIVGENYGTVIGCTFTGNVEGAGNVGGITGINALTGKIMGCEVSGSVIGADMTGGIAGCNLGYIVDSVNKAYVNMTSVDPGIAPEDINFDFLTDISKLTSMDVSSAATDSGGIAGYSSGIVKDCANKAPVGYPHIGYNVGGIVGRSCGYVCSCTNSAEVYGRKDVGGIAGQMEPYIAKNLTESSLAKLERQLAELDTLLDAAMEHAENTSSVLTNRLRGISASVSSAGSAAQNIRTTGTITSNVTGSADGSSDGSITVTPVEGNISGGVHGENGSVSGGGIQIGDGSIVGGSIHVGEGSVSAGVSGSVSGSIEGEGNGTIGAGLDAQTQIEINTNMAGLSSALYGMAGQINMLSGELGGASEELLEDAEQIKAKINEITENGFDLLMGNEDLIIDDSTKIDIDQITLGKVYASTNTGTINGDINIGGIVGDMGMEYALDPEDDLNVNMDSSIKRKYEVMAVIQHCENRGEVIAKRNYAGGIVGKMDLGLAAQCESYGSVSSESGNYVGGIAGICGSTIRHCFSKCTLSGNQYIGGIVGSGVEETKSGTSSTVAACYAIVSISDHEQYIGAISGSYAGTFLENYFVSEDLAGINRMSYTGCAEPLSYTELLARFEQPDEIEAADQEETENMEEDTEEGSKAEDIPEETVEADEPLAIVSAMELPDAFRKFNLKFVADGDVIYSDIFDYGATFSSDVFPDIPQKKGYYAYWDRTELENLRFDTTVTAIYEPYISALSSEAVRTGDKPVFFVQGEFGESDTLTANAMAVMPGAFDIADGIWDAIQKSLIDLKVSTEVVEQWQLQLSDDTAGAHTIRYLPPDGDAKHMDVYTRTDGDWQEAQTRIIGSYITFAAEGNDMEITIVHSRNTWWAWLIVAALVLAVMIFVICLIRKLAKRKTATRPVVSPEEQEEDNAASEPNTQTEPAKAKKHRWLMPLLVILALMLGIIGTSAFFLLPDLLAEKGAYEILKGYIAEDHIAMELSGEISMGEAQYSLSATVDRTTVNGQRISAILENGRTLYYSDGIVFLENGTAYQISAELPDYSRILEIAMELYRHIDVEKVNNVYSITAKETDAQEILQLLLPSAAAYFPDTDALLVELWEKDGMLSRITLSGDGHLGDEMHTAFSVNITLTVSEKAQKEVPAAVKNALENCTFEGKEMLTEDLYRLLTGWLNLNEANPLAADVTFDVDCGVLDLNERLNLYRWDVSGVQICAVERNGYGLYFTEDAICDRNGIRISAANAANLDTAKLLDILYTVCMNGSFQCTANEGQYTYTLALDEDGMAEVAYAVAPEAKKWNVTFSSGSVNLVMEKENIRDITVTIRGGVQVLLSKADMAISVTMDLLQDDSTPLPDKVKMALVNPVE